MAPANAPFARSHFKKRAPQARVTDRIRGLDLAKQVAYAAVEGLCGALPLSASGHRIAASVWLGEAEAALALTELAQIGCLAALIVVVRARLASAFAEGIRGIARPSVLQSQSGGRDAIAIAVGSIVAIGVDTGVRPTLSMLNDTPTVAAAGLLLTAAALASTGFAPAPRHLCPTALGAALVGLAHGLASVPGASRIGAAFIVLRWLGVTGWRAAEMAILITIPSLALAAIRLFAEPTTLLGGGPAAGELALAVTVAFVSASVAASWWKLLCERARTPWLGAWLVPLALALIGYGRALPHPTDPLPLSWMNQRRCPSCSCSARWTREPSAHGRQRAGGGPPRRGARPELAREPRSDLRQRLRALAAEGGGRGSLQGAAPHAEHVAAR